MNILVNAAQGFDFTTWSPLVPHYLPKKNQKQKRVERLGRRRWQWVLFLGKPTIYAIFGKTFPSLVCLCECLFSTVLCCTRPLPHFLAKKMWKVCWCRRLRAFELRYCLEVCFSILRLKKFQLRGSSTSRFLLNKLQCRTVPFPFHFLCPPAPHHLPLCYAKIGVQKKVLQPQTSPWLYLSPGPRQVLKWKSRHWVNKSKVFHAWPKLKETCI